MKKLIFSVLFAYSWTLVLGRPVLSNDCPPLTMAEITVLDNTIKLRTSPEKSEQTIIDDITGQPAKDSSGNNVRAAVIYKEEKLKIDQNTQPKNKDGVCYYPITLRLNGENSNPILLKNNPFWIPASGIKEYAKWTPAIKLENLNDKISKLQKENQQLQEEIRGIGMNSSSLLLFFSLPLVLLILFVPVIRKFVFSQLISLVKQFGIFLPKKLTRTKPGQQPNVPPESPNNSSNNTDGFTPNNSSSPCIETLISTNEQLSQHIHGIIDQNNFLLTQFSDDHIQNSQILTQLTSLVQSLKQVVDQHSKNDIDFNRLLEQFLRKDKEKDAAHIDARSYVQSVKTGQKTSNCESGITHSEPPQAEDDHKTTPSIQKSADPVDDPFYTEVIDRFNLLDLEWFTNQINSDKLRKVNITSDSVHGRCDMGGKITELQIDAVGTLLVFAAGNEEWLIPNCAEPKWKHCIQESCFTYTNIPEARLVSPARVENIQNDVWRVKQKGEFN
jgi:hypothetical protein